MRHRGRRALPRGAHQKGRRTRFSKQHSNLGYEVGREPLEQVVARPREYAAASVQQHLLSMPDVHEIEPLRVFGEGWEHPPAEDA